MINLLEMIKIYDEISRLSKIGELTIETLSFEQKI